MKDDAQVDFRSLADFGSLNQNNARVYNLYGLRVQSEIALPAPIAASDLPPYDLQVCWDERKTISDDAPAGEILAHLLLDNGRGYTLVDTGSGYIYFFHQTGEFWIDYNLRTVRVHLSPDVHPDFAALLVVGNVIACVLTLAGECVLHASAVEIGGMAPSLKSTLSPFASLRINHVVSEANPSANVLRTGLAFLGGSGMGKSTLAALLCANGARFITDDLLRLEPNGKGWRCFSGTGQLRLRKNAAALVENFSATMLQATPDDRIAVNLADSQSMPHLGAIVIPHLARNCDALKMERIPRAKALVYLMAYPRMQESAQREHRQRRLDFLGRIVASVPIFKAEIPWGLPFPRELADSLVTNGASFTD